MRRMAPLPPSLSLLRYGTNAYVHPAAVCYFCISILDYALIHQGVQLVVCTLEAVVLFFEIYWTSWAGCACDLLLLWYTSTWSASGRCGALLWSVLNYRGCPLVILRPEMKSGVHFRGQSSPADPCRLTSPFINANRCPVICLVCH